MPCKKQNLSVIFFYVRKRLFRPVFHGPPKARFGRLQADTSSRYVHFQPVTKPAFFRILPPPPRTKKGTTTTHNRSFVQQNCRAQKTSPPMNETTCLRQLPSGSHHSIPAQVSPPYPAAPPDISGILYAFSFPAEPPRCPLSSPAKKRTAHKNVRRPPSYSASRKVQYAVPLLFPSVCSSRGYSALP